MADPNKSRPYRIAIRDGMKLCRGCGTTKPVEEFHRRPERAGGRRSRCIACYKASPWGSREAVAKRAAKWRATKPESALAAVQRYRAANVEKERARVRAFKAANPQFNAINCGRRRARKIGAAGKFTAADVSALSELQRGKCAHSWCRVPLKDGHHIDHVMPLARGGSNDRRNLQLLCPACNMKKHAKHPIDFAQENGLLL